MKRANAILCCALATAVAVALPLTIRAADTPPPGQPTGSRQIARGRYLAIVGNCNDCHTADFAPRDSKVPESEWLRGSPGRGARHTRPTCA